MIFVDTSVWIAAFRSSSGTEAEHLSQLLDSDSVALAAPVRIELLSGASAQNRSRLRRNLSALPTFFPEMATWNLLDSWVDKAGAAGYRFGVADLLIGALAAEQRAAVWSLDSDFGYMAAIGFLETYQP